MPQAPFVIPHTLQDLPPKWAHFCLHVEKFIAEDLNIDLIGKSIVTAFSGGADSTCLLLIMQYLALKNGGRVVAVHLNHNLRLEAAEDSRWVQSVCDAMGIKYVVESKDIRALAQECSIGLEEAGRNARYELFQQVMIASSADYLAVGHHLDDLCEDVLMRLTRGTGWPGLSGMAGYDPARNLIRPLLLTSKTTLMEFLTDIHLEWREDASNTDSEWARNRIRNNVLPLFMKENPNFHESIARLWKLGRIEEHYWATRTTNISDTLSNEILKDAHQALRLRLYKASLDKHGQGQALANTLFKLDRAWLENRVGSKFQFPGNKTAAITASGVVFSCTH
ncbi:MAG: tRNA lysidine(34) synthetase TilS [Pseudodesulfovibrio sp.]|nr:tRNA lysidine(34) synthetase TilS [Pseudodesulfovibrio sp.]